MNQDKFPPNPGSDEAIAAGCRCPILDNGRGRGYGILNGVPQFVFNMDCPLHGATSEKYKKMWEEINNVRPS